MKNSSLKYFALAFLMVSRLLGESPTGSAGILQKAKRHERNGWIYLHLEGKPREMGFQHGYLLSKEFVSSLAARQGMWQYETALDWEWLVGHTKGFLVSKVDPDLREELEGMVEGLLARGVKTTLEEVVVYNAFFDLDWYWWPQQRREIGSSASPTKKQSCSSFIATGSMTSHGQIVLGHNTMFDYPEADFNVILDIAPSKGHRILMQTAPGMVHSGTDFFITDAGLIGSETTIGDFNAFDQSGIPEFVRMRRATQDANSIDQWCEIMKGGNNGGYANAWLLGDIKTGEIARLELGLKYIGFEKKKDGYFVGCNVAEDLKLLRFETDRNELDLRSSSVARKVRWNELMNENKGKINLGKAKRFEGDHYDTYLKRNFPGGRSLCGHFELDPQRGTGKVIPFDPTGTFDGKVVDSEMAKRMSFMGRWGSACGKSFFAGRFLEAHPQFNWMRPFLKDRIAEPWTEFQAGE